MARIIYGETERLMAWAGPRNDAGVIAGDTQAIGLEDEDGNIRSVVYFADFTTSNCSMHVVSDGNGNWLTRGFLAAVFAYPFVQMKLRRVTAYIAARNHRAMRFNMWLGFNFEGRMIEAGEDDDIFILGLLRRNCPWISEEHRNG